MTATFRILGINDEQTVCDCCGKTNLKKTVVLAILDADGNTDGETRYGVNCAARALRGSEKSGDRKQVETVATAVALAKKWLASGHAAEVVCKGIWNRFGYLTGVKNGVIEIGGLREVLATVQL